MYKMKKISHLLLLLVFFPSIIEAFNYFKRASSITQPYPRKTLEFPSNFPRFFGYASSNNLSITTSNVPTTIPSDHNTISPTDESEIAPTLSTDSPTKNLDSAKNDEKETNKYSTKKESNEESETSLPTIQPNLIENDTSLQPTVAPTESLRNALKIPQFTFDIETYSANTKIRSNNLLEATEFYLTEYLEMNVDHNFKFEEVTLEFIANNNNRRLSSSSQKQTYVFKGYAAFENLVAAKSSSSTINNLIEMSFTKDKTHYLSLLTKSGIQASDVTFTWVAAYNNPPEEKEDNDSYSIFLVIAGAAAFLATVTILIATSYYYRKQKKQNVHQNEVESHMEQQQSRSSSTAKLSLDKLDDATPIKDEIHLDGTSVTSEITFGTLWHKPPIRKSNPTRTKTAICSPPVIEETSNDKIRMDKIDEQEYDKNDMVSVCSYDYSLPGGVAPSVTADDNTKNEVESHMEQQQSRSLSTAKLSLDKLDDATPVEDEIHLDGTSVTSEITFGTLWHKPPIRKSNPTRTKTTICSPPVIEETSNDKIRMDKIDEQEYDKNDMVSVCSYDYSLPGGVAPSVTADDNTKKYPSKNEPSNLNATNEMLATISAVDDEDLFLSTYISDYP